MRVLFDGKCGAKGRYGSVAPENGLRVTGFPGNDPPPAIEASLSKLRRPLIILDFITALYRRDSLTARCCAIRLFLCRRKNPCAIFVAEISHLTPCLNRLARKNPEVRKNLFKTKAKGVKQ
jgi:hypothetical protein